MAKDVEIDWAVFKQRYWLSHSIFAYQKETEWVFYTSDDHFIVIARLAKLENTQDQALLEQGLFYDRKNITFAKKIEGEEDEEIDLSDLYDDVPDDILDEIYDEPEEDVEEESEEVEYKDDTELHEKD